MLYYCLSCNFVVHLNCAINNGNKKYINLLELNNEEFTQSKSMLENKNPKTQSIHQINNLQRKKNQCGHDLNSQKN